MHSGSIKEKVPFTVMGAKLAPGEGPVPSPSQPHEGPGGGRAAAHCGPHWPLPFLPILSCFAFSSASLSCDMFMSSLQQTLMVFVSFHESESKSFPSNSHTVCSHYATCLAALRWHLRAHSYPNLGSLGCGARSPQQERDGVSSLYSYTLHLIGCL